MYDRFKPFTILSSTQDIEEGLSKKVGRPTVGDNVENDNTATSLEQGNIVSDIKKFNNKTCVKCVNDTDGEILCDECLETLYQERLYELINPEKE